VTSPAAPLTGLRALVTGASRGIGLAVAEALRAAGAHTIRIARSLQDGTGDRDTTRHADLSHAGDVERVVERILADPGVPDIVVNNAGVFYVKHLVDTTPAMFAETLAVNLVAPFLVVHALLPHLLERDRGHLVTLGSVSDHAAFPGNAAYAASKFGVRGLHEVLRKEIAGSGVRATLISPGPVDTEAWDPINPDRLPGFTKRADMLRPEDVAEAVLFAVTRPPRVDVTELRLIPGGGKR
jgi:NADP-dependent 3-hydroxy acid dehydrogenase YdfG